ncbi:MAG: hypothetical protein LBH95_01935 [Oscillospiraceae bacterium]|jgi:hypothetical protein|nr:hypothetical protein [Oscillospiraceae bacterium]
MASEKDRVLDMLNEGKITAEDAARLLAALGGGKEEASGSGGVRETNPDLKGKKLRVKVDGATEGAKKINVNVAVPLALAKIADNLIMSVIPREVNSELEKEGINLKTLNLGELVDNLTGLDEDIVNVDLEAEGQPMKVRVYVE